MKKARYTALIEIEFEHNDNLRSIDQLVEFYTKQYDAILRSNIYYAMGDKVKKVRVQNTCVDVFESEESE